MNHEPIFTAEPIIGWRCWLVPKDSDNPPYYHSIYYQFHQWKVGEILDCHSHIRPPVNLQNHEGYQIRRAGATGFHAFRTLDGLIDAILDSGPFLSSDTPVAIGPTLLFGTVIEHEYGYRATKAYMPIRPLCLTPLMKLGGNMFRERLHEHFSEWIIK